MADKPVSILQEILDTLTGAQSEAETADESVKAYKARQDKIDRIRAELGGGKGAPPAPDKKPKSSSWI